MKRLLALAAALLLTGSCACAQEALSRGEIHAVADMLFSAAAGTTLDMETGAREGLSEEETLLRSAENAAYRAQVLPWLMEALRPQMQETPTEAESAETDESDGQVWTLEDGYAALMENELGATYLMLLRGYGGTDAESCMEVTRQICRMWMEEIDHAMLSGQNADYACWLYAPGMPIDYPVVHGTDNSYYLHHLFDGRKNASGTLFIDYRNLPDFQDPNTLIYGHHMRNQSMFGMLDEFETQAFYDSHPYMLLMSGTQVSIVELFAAYTTDSRDHCYDIAISDEEDMRAFIETAQRKSDFDAGAQILTTDRLITLSTCAYAFENARFIAIGRLLPVWQAEQEEAEGL